MLSGGVPGGVVPSSTFFSSGDFFFGPDGSGDRAMPSRSSRCSSSARAICPLRRLPPAAALAAAASSSFSLLSSGGTAPARTPPEIGGAHDVQNGEVLVVHGQALIPDVLPRLGHHDLQNIRPRQAEPLKQLPVVVPLTASVPTTTTGAQQRHRARLVVQWESSASLTATPARDHAPSGRPTSTPSRRTASVRTRTCARSDRARL